MTEVKDYTKYTFEDSAKLEIPKQDYIAILQGFQNLADNYSENHNKYKAISNILFAYLQKTDKDENTSQLQYNLFSFVDNQLRDLWTKELISFVDLKFDLINEKGKRVSKKVKGKKYSEPFSPELTASPDNKVNTHTTVEGQNILRILNRLQDIYKDNVDKGLGITIEELSNKQKEPKMEVVDADK